VILLKVFAVLGSVVVASPSCTALPPPAPGMVSIVEPDDGLGDWFGQEG
jgi:hypothetical protein